MTPDRDRVRLEHIRAAAREAMDLIQGKERADLDRERVLNLAVVRLLEIVGEAAARLTPDLRDRHPEIPWPLIVGLRNRLIHGYDTVNFDILWVILAHDLAPLVAAVDAILDDSSVHRDNPRSAEPGEPTGGDPGRETHEPS